MDFNHCKKSKLVKQIKEDAGLAQSLIDGAKKKLATQEVIPLNDVTASSKVSLTYDALREVLEALAIRKGYKIYNHECYCAFLKEIMGASSLGAEFDNFRKLRNDINYYGKDVAAQEVESVLEAMQAFIKEVRKLS